MRIHSVDAIPPGHIVVYENAQQVAAGRLRDLVYEPGDDSCTDVFLNPADVPAFEAEWLPSTTNRRLN